MSCYKEADADIATISYRTAQRYYPMNRDRSLQQEDLVHTILCHLMTRRRETGHLDAPLMCKIASDYAIDLLRYHNRRACLSLNDPIDSEDDEAPEWIDAIPGTPNLDQTVDQIAAQDFLRTVPPEILLVGQHILYDCPLSPTERQRVSRYRRRMMSHYERAIR